MIPRAELRKLDGALKRALEAPSINIQNKISKKAYDVHFVIRSKSPD